MPGPLIRPRKSPVLDALPEGVQSVLEALFPAGDVMGPAMPQTAVLGPAKAAGEGLIDALTPFVQNSLKRGKELIPEFLSPLPLISTLQRNLSYFQRHPEARELYSMLRDFSQNPKTMAENAKDPLKTLIYDRINVRPPAKSYVKLPTEELEFSASLGSHPMKRDPLVEQLYERWKNVDDMGGSVRAAGIDMLPTSSSSGKPALSGRWHNRGFGRTSSQGKILHKIYSKKPVK